MQILIQSDDIALSDGLREHIIRRLAYSLNHGRELISRIVVSLTDTNGPRGGVDKRCGIEVRFKGQPALVIDDTQADLYVAINRAAERTGRTLYHRITRRSRPAAQHLAHPDPEARA